MDANCTRCVYAKEPSPTDPRSIVAVGDEPRPLVCRRFPPLVLQPSYGKYSMAPLVTEHDWCGEYSARLDPNAL